MGFDMNARTLKKFCREQRLYASLPELNEVFHLHNKGIIEIKGLDQYTGLKTLHLEANAISRIEGLNHLVNLRCLHLNQNLVEDVTGLDTLPSLESLDLADNQIKCIRGLSSCPSLRQLNLSGNLIQFEEDVSHLSECLSLQSLDMARNRIDNKKCLESIRSLPLRLLKMSGNPILSMIQHYRKTTVVCMPQLIYLDDSPVTDKERRLAVAWLEGGHEEERLVRETMRREEADQRDAHQRAFEEMIEKATAQLAAMEQEKINKALMHQENEEINKVPKATQDGANNIEQNEQRNNHEDRHQDVKEIENTCHNQDEENKKDMDDIKGAEDPTAFQEAEQCEWIEGAERERIYRKNLHEKILRRATQGNAVWGTQAYKHLWNLAIERSQEEVKDTLKDLFQESEEQELVENKAAFQSEV